MIRLLVREISSVVNQLMWQILWLQTQLELQFDTLIPGAPQKL